MRAHQCLEDARAEPASAYPYRNESRPRVSPGGEELVGGTRHCPFGQKILIFTSGLGSILR